MRIDLALSSPRMMIYVVPTIFPDKMGSNVMVGSTIAGGFVGGLGHGNGFKERVLVGLRRLSPLILIGAVSQLALSMTCLLQFKILE